MVRRLRINAGGLRINTYHSRSNDEDTMDQNLKNYLAEELSKQRSALLGRRSVHEESFQQLAGEREIELEERAQEDRIAAVLESLEDRDHERLREIELALERLAAGDFACGDFGGAG